MTNALILIAAIAVLISAVDQIWQRRKWNELEKERLKLSIELLKLQLELEECEE